MSPFGVRQMPRPPYIFHLKMVADRIAHYAIGPSVDLNTGFCTRLAARAFVRTLLST